MRQSKDPHPRSSAGRDNETVWRVTQRTEKECATVISKGLVVLDGKGCRLFLRSSEPKGTKARSIRLNENQSLLVSRDLGTQDLWEVSKDTQSYVHPTQKPVELSARAIANSSRMGDIVLDPFLGSGSTLIGAEKLKRRCYGTELDPKYIDAIVKRWQTFTNKSALLEATDQTFEEVSKGPNMRTGPPPKPTLLKILAGNPGKRPLNADEPQPERTAPLCPEWLNDSAKTFWSDIAPKLTRLGVLTEIDGEALTALCLALADLKNAQEQIKKVGYIVKTPSGYAQPNPFVGISNLALKQIRSLLQEFGMTPSARSRVLMQAGFKEDENDRGKRDLKARLFQK